MVVASIVVFGASAYTSATVDRSADMNVVSDANGLIGLQDGTTSLVHQNASNELSIDFARHGATGVNTNANFTIGNLSAPTTTYAFTVSNNAGNSHTFNVSYDGFHSSGTSDNLRFRIYDSSGNFVQELNESATNADISVASSSTYYVVMVVNTGDGITDLETSADISGTLRISV